MAIIRPGRASRRPASVGKHIVLYTFQGRTYVRSWPAKRGKPKQPYQQAALDRLRLQQQAVKFTSVDEYDTMDRGLKAFLREHRGVRGTAAIRLRDWLTGITFGRAFSWSWQGRPRVVSAAVVQDCSDFLDHLEPRLGSLMTRTPDSWLPTVQCRPGAVLTCAHSGLYPGACPAATLPKRNEAIGGY